MNAREIQLDMGQDCGQRCGERDVEEKEMGIPHLSFRGHLKSLLLSVLLCSWAGESRRLCLGRWGGHGAIQILVP